MQPIKEELEFDEAELYGDNGEFQRQSSDGGESSGSDVELEDATCMAGELPQTGHDLESSAKSSTLHVSLAQTAEEEEEDLFDVQPRAAGAGARPIAQSLPVQSNIRMGTSVPISIPMMGRWKKNEEGGEQAMPADPEPQYPATFVPPHQFSQRDDFMFSFTGDSPGVALKRERLRARNVILKSTGFLEPEVKNINTIGLQERNRLVVGGLTQALHSVNASQVAL